MAAATIHIAAADIARMEAGPVIAVAADVDSAVGMPYRVLPVITRQQGELPALQAAARRYGHHRAAGYYREVTGHRQGTTLTSATATHCHRADMRETDITGSAGARIHTTITLIPATSTIPISVCSPSV